MKSGVAEFRQGFTRALPGLVYRIPPVRRWRLRHEGRWGAAAPHLNDICTQLAHIDVKDRSNVDSFQFFRNGSILQPVF